MGKSSGFGEKKSGLAHPSEGFFAQKPSNFLSLICLWAAFADHLQAMTFHSLVQIEDCCRRTPIYLPKPAPPYNP